MTELLNHPTTPDAVAQAMRHIYRVGTTTTSGGNISVRDDDGSVWITPAGPDKGELREVDVVRLRPDGRTEGRRAPSTEAPFHRAIYAARPELRAVIHAHPAALVAFSIVRERPDLSPFPEARAVCGEIGYAPYAVPGSAALGERIAAGFGAGHDAVIMENHALVVGGRDLEGALLRFEALEHAAQVLVHARALGGTVTPGNEAPGSDESWPVAERLEPSESEAEGRQALAEMARRAARQGLMPAAFGCLSLRLGPDDFLVTPGGLPHRAMTRGAVVRVVGGRCEAGARPHPAARTHRALYQSDPDRNAVISAQPPHLMAYAVAGIRPDVRTIPESWILLQDLPLAPAGLPGADPRAFAGMFGPRSPAVLVANEGITLGGATLLEAFDRLEVAEFSARSLLLARSLGTVQPIDDAQVEALRKKFFPS